MEYIIDSLMIWVPRIAVWFAILLALGLLVLGAVALANNIIRILKGKNQD